LIEVLVAVLLIGLGCFAAFSAQFSAIRAKSVSDHVMVASFLANSELERLRTLTHNELFHLKDYDEDKLTALGLVCPDKSCPGVEYLRAVKFYRKTPTAMSCQVEIHVRWRDIAGERSIARTAILTGSTFS
jgi:hypothetical protein